MAVGCHSSVGDGVIVGIGIIELQATNRQRLNIAKSFMFTSNGLCRNSYYKSISSTGKIRGWSST